MEGKGTQESDDPDCFFDKSNKIKIFLIIFLTTTTVRLSVKKQFIPYLIKTIRL